MENIPGFLHLVSESYQKEGASDILPDDSANTADSANYADSTNNELGSIHRIPQPPNELLKAHSSRAAKPEAGSNDPFYLIKNSLRGHIHRGLFTGGASTSETPSRSALEDGCE